MSDFRPSPHRLVLLVCCLFLLAACRQSVASPSEQIAPPAAVALVATPVAPTATPSPTPVPTTTSTPTPTMTATPTPTQTPTAIAAGVEGDPRQALLSDPAPVAGAPCGVVDTLDFPIDPPDATGVNRGGADFGIYRRRYSKFHAGEDWRGPGSGSSFGVPVYSIGHGRVTYAHPDGWGRDKGVVIIRHTFSDGSTFLSFYGHLDPPSVILSAGDCVARGATVGNIGRPRTSPHLHFEIRTHMPAEPGPGYWADDPTAVGWLPPTLTILQHRLRAAPGVVWAAPPETGGSGRAAIVGEMEDGTLVVLDGGHVRGLAAETARLLWQIDGGAVAALLIDDRLFIADRAGTLSAFAPTGASNPEPEWTAELAFRGTPSLLPAPAGGVIIADRDQWQAFSQQGQRKWRLDAQGPVTDWLMHEEQIIASLSGSEGTLLAVDAQGTVAWRLPGSGHLALFQGMLAVYGQNGLGQVTAAGREQGALLALPTARLAQGDLLALPDGGLLLAHSDVFDRRLIAFNADGTVRWDHSLRQLGRASDQLLQAGDQVYLLSVPSTSLGTLAAAQDTALFVVDPVAGRLARLFSAAARLALPGQRGGTTLRSGDLLFVGGAGTLARFNPEIARQSVVPAWVTPAVNDEDGLP